MIQLIPPFFFLFICHCIMSERRTLVTEPLLKNFHISKIFKSSNGKVINSLDFHRSGELLVTAGDDEAIHVYNSVEGIEQRALYSKKYGVDLVRFTNHQNAIICASKNGWDESIRYLSLHDNKYLRYFKGHRDRVVSLVMAPLSDQFISGSLDETVRVWDLRSPQCVGLLRLPRGSRPAISYDPQGLVVAIASANNTLKLFDPRSFDKGPFGTFQIPYSRVVEWTSMKFSPDGKYILLATNEAMIFLIDAFNGECVKTYSSHVNDNAINLEANFTPDGEYVFSGSEDATIRFWKRSTGVEVAAYQGHAGPVLVSAFNPRYASFASACSALALW